MTRRKVLYLIDANHMLYRAFHASPPLTTSAGAPTGALTTFGSMLWALLTKEHFTHIGAIFDPIGVSFRSDLYPDYKGNRSAPPDALTAQFPFFPAIAEAMGVKTMRIPGFEADDVIGTLAHQAALAKVRVVIVTGDKDMMQCITPSISILDTKKKKVIRRKEVLERFGVAPERVADVLALAGDSSDNIPGVPGVGELTAVKLLAQFRSLDGILDNIDEIPGKKRRANFMEHKDNVRLYRKLTQIRTDVPLTFQGREWAWSGVDEDTLLPLLGTLEIRTLKSRIEMHLAASRKPPAKGADAPNPGTLESFFGI